MSRSLLRVGRSKTGLGLFAKRPIKKRTIFAEYKGPRLSSKEAEKMEGRGSRYLYEINGRWTVDGSPRSNLARYANHACRPNSESDILYGKRAEGRKGGKIVLRSIRNIQPGDEITYDYGKDYWTSYIGRDNCLCTSCVRRRKKERAEARLKRLRKQRREAAKRAKSRATARSRRNKASRKKASRKNASNLRTSRKAR
jgi:SET domain-containing protein